MEKTSQNKAKDVEKRQQPVNDMQALQLIDQACSMAPLNRQTHVQVQQALRQISRALQRLDAFMFAGEMDKQDKKKD